MEPRRHLRQVDTDPMLSAPVRSRLDFAGTGSSRSAGQRPVVIPRGRMNLLHPAGGVTVVVM
jgi:hypothetical protein